MRQRRRGVSGQKWFWEGGTTTTSAPAPSTCGRNHPRAARADHSEPRARIGCRARLALDRRSRECGGTRRVGAGALQALGASPEMARAIASHGVRAAADREIELSEKAGIGFLFPQPVVSQSIVSQPVVPEPDGSSESGESASIRRARSAQSRRRRSSSLGRVGSICCLRSVFASQLWGRARPHLTAPSKPNDSQANFRRRGSWW